MVESTSTVSGPSPGPAPAAQALARTSPVTLSSWRTCPKVNARSHVPTVEAAITRWPSTAWDVDLVQHDMRGSHRKVSSDSGIVTAWQPSFSLVREPFQDHTTTCASLIGESRFKPWLARTL